MAHTSTPSNTLNRLASAKSPYLLQHADNPVDWYEWGQEAFQKAKDEDKPIFLSVGYSACHWCHVLAHESFEDKATAKLLNDNFVNIKVDREERPDVDRLYMTFLQATSGGGGWPMSIWLTPELHPFFAGTYFPPDQFRAILSRLASVWEDNREKVIGGGKDILDQLRAGTNFSTSSSSSNDLPLNEIFSKTYAHLAKRFDPKHGGFSTLPKFPSPAQTLHFLARYAALNPENDKGKIRKSVDMGVTTLVKIYKGGIRDVVGGGFARYSVDEKWHVPHFEKMLYDQAQLLTSALEFSLLIPSSDPSHPILQDMAKDIIRYVSLYLKSPEGGFYSSEDADSVPAFEGGPGKLTEVEDSHGKIEKVEPKPKEGAFYVWTEEELDNLLGGDSEVFKYLFGVEKGGNCDPRHDIQGELKGKNVLHTAHSVEEAAKKFSKPAEEVTSIQKRCLVKLKVCRDTVRPRPHLDDKILTCWNGLMISGLSKAHEILGADSDLRPLELAEDAAKFIRQNLYDEHTAELRRSWREGKGPVGQADDYAFLIKGLLDLYEASATEEYLIWAIRLQDKQNELFFDEKNGGYFSSAPDPSILIRIKDVQDAAEPSAASISLANLFRLSHFVEDKCQDHQAKAESLIASNGRIMEKAPFALATMVAETLCGKGKKGYRQFIVTGSPPSTLPLLQPIQLKFIPNRVLIHIDPTSPPRKLAEVNETVKSLVQDSGGEQGETIKPNVRICENFTCGLPIEDVKEVQKVVLG